MSNNVQAVYQHISYISHFNMLASNKESDIKAKCLPVVCPKMDCFPQIVEMLGCLESLRILVESVVMSSMLKIKPSLLPMSLDFFELFSSWHMSEGNMAK